MNGYIKLHRQLMEWEWYKNIPVRILFEHCLLKANHKEKKWQGIVIPKGSFVTSYENLAFETGLTVQQVRTAINKLKSTSEITYKSTSHYSIITVNNWERFQEDNTQNNKQITNNQQTNNKQITTTKNDKNDKNEKNTLSIVGKENSYKDMFKEFWRKYPKKIDQYRAFVTFFKILEEQEASLMEILNGVDAYNKYIEAIGTETRYISTPYNWLKNRKWNDDYTINAPPQKEKSILERIGRA